VLTALTLVQIYIRYKPVLLRGRRPAAGAIALLASGAVSDGHALLMAEHIAMFPAMLVVMLLRRDEYECHGSSRGDLLAAHRSRDRQSAPRPRPF
jgi:hypothetical protein